MRQEMVQSHLISPLEMLAYHEAGHAVSACLLGRGVVRASIGPVAGSPGNARCLFREVELPTQVSPKLGSPGRALLEREIMIALAGDAAVCLRTVGGDSFLGPGPNQAACHDWPMAANHAMVLSGQRPQEAMAVLSLGMVRVFASLSAPDVWAGVEAVATKLAAKSRLSGKRINELIRLASATPVAPPVTVENSRVVAFKTCEVLDTRDQKLREKLAGPLDATLVTELIENRVKATFDLGRELAPPSGGQPSPTDLTNLMRIAAHAYRAITG